MPSPEKMSLERREACRESQSGCPASRTRPSADCRAVGHPQGCLQSFLCWRLCATSLTSWHVLFACSSREPSLAQENLPLTKTVDSLLQKAADSESEDRNAAACLVNDSGYWK